MLLSDNTTGNWWILCFLSQSRKHKMVVNTRAGVLQPPPVTVESLPAAVEALQKNVSDLLAQNQALNTALQNLMAGEGTSHNRGTQYGRMSKIEFPRFSGEDVKGWLFRCKQFFKIEGILDEMKIEIASMHLYDKALN